MRRGIVRVAAQALALSLCGCGGQPETALTPEDRILATQTGLPEPLVLEAKTWGENLHRLAGIDDAGNTTELAGVTVEVSSRSSKKAAKALQDAAPPGYFAYVSERNFDIDGRPDSVSIMKSADPYEVILAMGTNGWNYDLSPANVVAELKQWDKQYGLVFRGISFDWLEAEFTTPPSDMHAFRGASL